MKTSFLYFILLSVSFKAALAQESGQSESKSNQMTVYGRKRSSKKITGTRYEIKRSETEAFSDVDPHKVISEAPGVYVQDEDGFGLRPNIGIRGTHPHRSKKITLLEDGVFLGPAPYSAPAAYYFPQMTKITGADLIKGSMSSLYGPTSIGGTFNFKTREITNQKLSGGIGLTSGAVRRDRDGFTQRGSDSTRDRYAGTNLITGHVSQNFGSFSYLVEAGTVDARGFKELGDINDETGFEKWDGLVKLGFRLDKRQKVELKASRASELSNETYLGLTDSDFSVNPFQRYAASQLDQMDWDQEQVSLTYENKISKNKSFLLTAYNQNFQRSWNKFDRFAGSNTPAVRDILNNPELPAYNEYYRLLTGEINSINTGVDTLVLTDNAREYYSRGVQGVYNYNMRLGEFGQTRLKNTTGVRYHRDSVSRNHVSSFYDIFDGVLEKEFSDSLEDETVTRNKEESEVFSLFHQTSFQKNSWTVDTSFRLERVFQEGNNFLTDELYDKTQTLFAPGVGVSKTVGSSSVVFAGVHRGIGAAGPGQSEGARPEESVNYELGYRSISRQGRIEVAAFATDYQNIKGFCSASSGCAQERLEEEFSGGSALIYGLEASLKTMRYVGRRKFPLSASYTLTSTEFNNTFESGAENEWGAGVVESGDPLPYIPKHQFSLSAGFNIGKALIQARWNKRTSVFDQSVKEGREKIKGYELTDVALSLPLRKKLLLSASIDNVFGEEYVSSLRPFGARPGMPRHYKLGLNYKF